MRIAAIFACVAAASCGGEVDPEPAYEHPTGSQRRVFAGTGWDTVLHVGGRDPNDTTLLSPGWVLLWGDRLALLDGPNQNARVLSKRGELLWTVGTWGGGPNEFRQVSDLAVAPNGNLMLLDPGNIKLMEFAADGEFVRSIPLHDLPVLVSRLLLLSDRVVFPTQSPEHGLIEADTALLRMRSTRPFPWSEPLDPSLNLAMARAASSAADTWFLGFTHGPGFMIYRGDSVAVHRYIEPKPYVLKSGPHIMAMGADSARFAARSASIVGDELFLLFGGRPRRQEHPAGEPTVLIDVYGLDGAYRRSYRLGSDTRAMATEDGRTFYILTETEEGLPVLLALSVREG